MANPEYVTAIDIRTERWSDIILYCKSQGWEIISEYEGFDKGIDFDFYTLKKGDEEIKFGWDNFSEGEMTCKEPVMVEIETGMNIRLKRKGDPDEQTGELKDTYSFFNKRFPRSDQSQ